MQEYPGALYTITSPKKKISVTVGDDGEEMIDTSELERVYGSELVLKNMKLLHENESSVQSSASTQSNVQFDVQMQIKLLEQKIDGLLELNSELKQSSEREREQHLEEKGHLRESLKTAQEGYNQITRLLEDQRHEKDTGDAWKQAIDALEKRIANQEASVQKKEEREQQILRQNRALKRALDEEKSKSIWKKLFG